MAVSHRSGMPSCDLHGFRAEAASDAGLGITGRGQAARISYAREELEGGPLLKGRKKLAATRRGDLYSKLESVSSTTPGSDSDTADARRPIGALPPLQSPRQLH